MMWIIFMKEVRELLRDRKTLLFTVLIPVFALPLLSVVFSYGAAKLAERDRNQELTYVIAGEQYAPALTELFAQQPNFAR